MVPLRIEIKDTHDVVWSNPRSSSVRFCRPIRIQWIRETTDSAKAEQKYIEDQICALQPFVMNNCKINFSSQLTMVDGKVCKLLSINSLDNILNEF